MRQAPRYASNVEVLLVNKADAAKPLQDFLAGRLGLSRRAAKAIIDGRSVWVNRRCVWIAHHALKTGDAVEIPRAVISAAKRQKGSNVAQKPMSVRSGGSAASPTGAPRGSDTLVASRIGYVRYMDDFVYWADDKDLLCRVRDAVGDYLVDELGLQLKDSPYINRTAHGMDFLGFRIRPDGLRAAREGLRRYKRKMRMCGMLFREGALSESAYQDRITALTAPLLLARTRGWRCTHLGDLARSVGREPRETGRELEQRGGQLPAGVSQQQHSVEPQQQQRLPPALLRSVAI